MLEGDALACCTATHAVGGGVDHLGPGELRQHIEHGAGEHVATGDGFVLEDAVVEQVDRAALVHAQQGGGGGAGEAGAGLGEPDEFGQLREAHVAADLAVGVEQRFGGQAAELEAAAEVLDGIALGAGVALRHALHPLGGDGAGDAVVHLDQDEAAVAAVLGVLLHHGMAGRAGAGETVEDEGILVSGKSQNTLQ